MILATLLAVLTYVPLDLSPEPEPEEPTGPDAVGTDILVEAESFATKGDWVVDPQFVEQMGSPYLLAHGRGIPCADATTKVVFPSAGRVRAWVRTRDWTPDWDGEKPGQFRLAVGSKVFPNVLGVSPANWGWVDAGVISMVSNGEKPIYLKDLTGFEGRCDAIYFTPASVTTPPPNDPNPTFLIIGKLEKVSDGTCGLSASFGNIAA